MSGASIFSRLLALALSDQDIVVTNLANTATEWLASRPSDGNLYAVGMGMVTPYALGLALALPKRRVVALDGDGGIFFDPSVLGLIATRPVPNLTIIVFDNGGYISTGRLPAVGSLSALGVNIAEYRARVWRRRCRRGARRRLFRDGVRCACLERTARGRRPVQHRAAVRRAAADGPQGEQISLRALHRERRRAFASSSHRPRSMVRRPPPMSCRTFQRTRSSARC